MAADDDTDPYAAPPPVAQYLNPPLTVGNPELAKKFLAGHQNALGGYRQDYDQTMDTRQSAVDRATSILDETTAALKRNHDGWKVNLPLLSMGAGMLSSRGNFGEQLGAGVGAMAPAIAHERAGEDDYQSRLAQLALKRADLEGAPLDKKLEFLRAMQLGELGATRSIETAMMRTPGASAMNAQTKEAQLVQKAVQNAVQNAEKEFSSTYHQSDTSDTEEVNGIKRALLMKHINIMKASGIPIPDDVIAHIAGNGAGSPVQPVGGGTPQIGGSLAKLGTFEKPTPEMLNRAGLPDAPEITEYTGLRPKELAQTQTDVRKQFLKQSQDWVAEDAANRNTQQLLDEFEQLQKKPGVVGRHAGLIPGSMVPNLSPESQELQKIIRQLEAAQFVKGQGAVSNYERKLFSEQVPNMDNQPEANSRIIGMMKQTLARNAERRQYLKEYFMAHKTLSGAEDAWSRYLNADNGGSFVVPDAKGNIVANPNRRGYRDFFRDEREKAQQPQMRARGGSIHLGAEYD